MKTSCPLAEDVNETPAFDVLSSQAAVTIFIVSILFYSLNFVCPHTCAFTTFHFFFRVIAPAWEYNKFICNIAGFQYIWI